MQSLAAFSRPDGIVFLFIRTEIIRFSFERDLRAPSSGAPVPVNAGYAAGVGGAQAPSASFQNGNGRTLAELEIFQKLLFLQAAAAFCLTALQVRLAYKRFLSAVAFAAPQVLPVFFACVTGHGQHGKSLAEIVFQRRMAQTAAAFPVARRKLVQRRVNFTAAVAAAVPDGRPRGIPRRQRVLRGQTPEALTGDISLPRLDTCVAAAVCDGAALQSACVEQDFSATVAAAAPDGVAVFALTGRRFDAQTAGTITNRNFRDAHFFLYPYINEIVIQTARMRGIPFHRRNGTASERRPLSAPGQGRAQSAHRRLFRSDRR